MSKKKATEVTEQKQATAQTEAVIVTMPPISTGKMIVTIRGLSSLIVHAFGVKGVRQMLEGMQMTPEEKRKSKANRKQKDPKADFEDSKYVINGKDSFPTIAVKAAMVRAGMAVGIASTVIRQALFIQGDYFTIKHGKCVMREDVVRVGKFPNKVPDLRYRPEYKDWSADLSIMYRKDMINEKNVIALLQNAGFSVGIGEWRPEKNGQFGTFEVT